MDTISDVLRGPYWRSQGNLAESMGGGLENKGSESLELLIVCAAQGDYVREAAKAAGELYGYGHTNVLFKPTKAGGNMNMLFLALFFE